MTAPVDRKSLHERRKSVGRSGDSPEDRLDALLNENCKPQKPACLTDTQTCVRRSPIDELRDLFRESLVPHINELAERYRAKGVDLRMDASDFLGGGRGVLLDLSFGERRIVLEGTVMPEQVAFSRASYVGGMGGTMSSGPSLRTGTLNPKRFTDFVCEHIIALVRGANAH